MAAEPAVTVTGAAAGAAVAMVPAVAMGVQTDALGLGLFAAMLVTLWLGSIDTRRKAFAAVGLSGLLAGYFSPHAAAYAATKFTSLSADPSSLRMPMALLIAIAAPFLVPLALIGAQAIARTWIARKGGAE